MTALNPAKRAEAEDLDEAESTTGSGQASRAVLVCYRRCQNGPITAEFTYWETCEQARQAEADLSPCGPLCIGVHGVARIDLMPVPRRRAKRDQPVAAGSGLIPADEVNQ